jgi:hypothetical protein
VLRSTRSDVIADVQIATAIPKTPYDVRVIELSARRRRAAMPAAPA